MHPANIIGRESLILICRVDECVSYSQLFNRFAFLHCSHGTNSEQIAQHSSARTRFELGLDPCRSVAPGGGTFA